NPGERQVEELLHLRHRRDKTCALGFVEGRESLFGEEIAEPIERLQLFAASSGQVGVATAQVRFEGGDLNEAVLLDCMQQSTEITGIEVQPGAQIPDIRARFSDLEQQPCLRKGSATPQKTARERTDPQGQGTVEAAGGTNRIICH